MILKTSPAPWLTKKTTCRSDKVGCGQPLRFSVAWQHLAVSSAGPLLLSRTGRFLIGTPIVLRTAPPLTAVVCYVTMRQQAGALALERVKMLRLARLLTAAALLVPSAAPLSRFDAVQL